MRRRKASAAILRGVVIRWRRRVSEAAGSCRFGSASMPFARAVAPGLPGYGGADKPDRFDYTVEGYARHPGGLLDEFGIRRAHLVLHDFGGPWGLLWAAQHPDQFASATLINTRMLRDYR
jgi:pimeloyl-ACP methyl ester carboxylesterase